MTSKKKSKIDLPAQAARRAAHKLKEPGRKQGTPNRKSTYIRSEAFNTRYTKGYIETLEALQQLPGKLSKTDHIHHALQQYAYRMLPAGTTCTTKII